MNHKPLINLSFFKTGHRGARGLYPENTIEGMKLALRLGMNTIEFDVVVSKDKKLVVSHEPYMNHEICLKPDGSIIFPEDEKNYSLYKMTYEEIHQFDCGSKIHPRFPIQQKNIECKPLLSDLFKTLEVFKSELLLSSFIYDIELKSEESEYGFSQPHPEEFCQLVLSMINEHQLLNRVIFRSFDKKILQTLHSIDPNLPIALIVEDQLPVQQQLINLGFNPFIYSPLYSLVTPKDLYFLHSRAIKVVPWTVNHPDTMRTLIEMKVDGIITDFPDRLTEIVP